MRTRRTQSSSSPVSRADKPVHHPVLLHEVIEALALHGSDVVVDATLGGAGHARVLCEHLGEKGTFIGFDADASALERTRDALETCSAKHHLVQTNFRDIEIRLNELGISAVDKVLIDLGWSAYQLADGRGFSFQSEEPLRMTYDATQETPTAVEIVNKWAEESIADILHGWGEERFARRIARAICEARQGAPITTARQLAEIVTEAVPARYRHHRIHPATKTFQALRIAVNDELGALTEVLQGARAMLAPAGRIAVISFHSIEDRIVKRTFREWVQAGEGTLATKRPITASSAELEEHPRSRSAKLRTFIRIN